MLGENHSLLSDFPELKEHIIELSQNDDQFSAQAKRYDELDAEIRELELSNSPIDDGAMHQLKHDRAELKDQLYRQLVIED